MLYFQSIGEAEAVFKALSTPMRLKIMEMIYEDDTLSMNDLAEALGLTNGAISMHVNKLEEAGLVIIKTTSGKRGTMKIVRKSKNKWLKLKRSLEPYGANSVCVKQYMRKHNTLPRNKGRHRNCYNKQKRR